MPYCPLPRPLRPGLDSGACGSGLFDGRGPGDKYLPCAYPRKWVAPATHGRDTLMRDWVNHQECSSAAPPGRARLYQVGRWPLWRDPFPAKRTVRWAVARDVRSLPTI